MNILILIHQQYDQKNSENDSHQILVTSLKNYQKSPMIVSAAETLLNIDSSSNSIFFIDQTSGCSPLLQETAHRFFPLSQFLTVKYFHDAEVDEYLPIKNSVKQDVSLTIGYHNRVMIADVVLENLWKNYDVLIAIHTQNIHQEIYFPYISIVLDDTGTVLSVITSREGTSPSLHPQQIYVIVGAVCFRRTNDYVRVIRKMREHNSDDSSKKGCYITSVVDYALNMGMKMGTFAGRYISWETERDRQIYEKTIAYWRDFMSKESSL